MKQSYHRLRLAGVLVMTLLMASPAWAYKRETRVTIAGSNTYYLASGTVRHLAIWNEPGTNDRLELIIEIKHVPLPPGTVLVVYVADEMLGQIVVKKDQTGLLKITSETRHHIPRIKYGTSVMLTKIDGTTVMW